MLRVLPSNGCGYLCVLGAWVVLINVGVRRWGRKSEITSWDAAQHLATPGNTSGVNSHPLKTALN